MEFGLKPQNHPRDPGYLGSSHQTAAPLHTHPARPKLEDILTSEKATLSYADFHSQITKNEASVRPKTSRAQQSRGSRYLVKEDEMLRHVPRMQENLERGKGYQEKNVLNVGVIDWRRLEKWRNGNSQMPPHTGCSSSAHPKADESFSHSSRGLIIAPGSPRSRHSSLQSQLEASPKRTVSSRDKNYKGRGRSISPSRQRTYHLVPQSHHPKVYPSDGQVVNDGALLSGNARKPEGVSSSAAYDMIRQQSQYESDQSFRECQSKARLEIRKKKLFTVVTGSETEKSQSVSNCHAAAAASVQKGKMVILESELRKEALQPKGHSSSTKDAEPEFSGRSSNRVTILMPRGSKSRALYSSTSETHNAEEDTGRRSLFENHESKKEVGVSSHNNRSDVPHSCPLPVKEESKRVSEVREPSAGDRHRSKVFPRSMRSVSSPLRGGKFMDDSKPSVVLHKSSGELKMSSELEKTAASEPATKTRHPSPIRRLSSAMGSIIRSAGSRESSPIRRSSSKEAVVVQPGLGRAAAASSSADSPTDKSHVNNSRSRSSPLRRLLDPLLKPKTPGDDEPSKRNMASASVPWKSSSHEQLKLLREQSTSKVNSKFVDGRHHHHHHQQNPKQGSAVKLQALLQVAVKNGLPLFTFAVDGCSDILAATLRKSEKTQQPSWIYTFFTVQEIKKKNGLWLHHQAKKSGDNNSSNNNQGYIPDVVAQMKVSNPQSATTITWPKGGSSIQDDPVREFSLFSVDVSQMDHQHAVEFQPVNELAAVVVKLVDDSSPRYCLRGSSRDNNSDSLKGSMSTTVILPGGVHTIPSKGSVSTLTQRWKSGGSCDCGGWDIGCQLRVFNHHHHGKLGKTTTTSSYNYSKATTDAAVDEFQLFNQVGQESQLVLSLSPFKERIYSVEFDSSISILQAFAISVSVLDCRGSGISHDLIQAMAKATLLSSDVPQGGGAAVAALASCLSYSPVGRA